MIKNILIEDTVSLNALKDKQDFFNTIIINLPIYEEDVISPFNTKLKNSVSSNTILEIIQTVENSLEKDGYLFIYGSPSQLIEVYSGLPSIFKFRHWISIDAVNQIEPVILNHLKHSHLGLLMLSKGNKHSRLDTKNTRFPYIACSACGKNVKDWGGKKHLMNTKGAGISDVWRDFYKIKATKTDPDNSKITLNIIDPSKDTVQLDGTGINKQIHQRIISLVGENNKILNINISKKLLKPLVNKVASIQRKNVLVDSSAISNKVILGDCIKEMEKLCNKYPEGVFDLVFADPPYNLKKDYKLYDDELADQEYIDWCNKWLELCVRLTKPTGSIFILNIPKWGLEHAKFLNKIAYLQNWIVWDALSIPKGKIMPAHYALLYYTKNPTGFTYNKPELIDHQSYCVRNSCVQSRKHDLLHTTYKVEVSDFWSDLHRIKHKKNRDDHPCQLPDKLMDRVIQTFSRENDLVFDPFAGAGTTAIRSLKNNRRYTTIEIDPAYKEITERKILDVKNNGEIKRQPVTQKTKTLYTKKFLETKAQELSIKLGKRPSLQEFISAYSLDVSAIEKLYKNPQQMLKAGRIGLLNGGL